MLGSFFSENFNFKSGEIFSIPPHKVNYHLIEIYYFKNSNTHLQTNEKFMI